jgi:hypothetical protein
MSLSEFETIEDYRNHFFTEKEEWNNFYNPKRCSIDALTKIEIKQRGKGPEKKLFTERAINPGPYYDPKSLHVHIWKSSILITDFICEQNPSVPFIEYTNVKNGTFCCICHSKNRNYSFKWNPAVYKECEEIKEIFVNRNGYSCEDYIDNPIFFAENKIDKDLDVDIETTKRGVLNWGRLISKVNYSINFTKTIYPISTYKSLYLWPWEMTFYQRLNLKIPDYKKSVIFIKNEIEDFRTRYSYIE